jgi:thiol:disulfide interchange protein
MDGIVTRRIVVCAALALLTAVAQARAQDPVHWSLAPGAKGPVKAGTAVTVIATAEIDSGWHLYAMSEPPGGPPPLTIVIPKGVVFKLDGNVVVQTPPETKIDPNFNNLATEIHEGKAIFILPVRVAAGTANGSHKLTVIASYVTCSDKICLPPKDDEITIQIGVGSSGSTGSTGSAGSSTLPPALAPVPPASVRTSVSDLAASSRASTLGAYIGLAALMGALSLVTPCVFPMVPITVSYFTNRARRSRREAVTQAAIYGIGIILTFTAVGFTLAIGFGASGLNRFAADPWLNLGVTALFVWFALSLFGVWELALPSKLVTMATKAESGRGRLASTLLMGLAFTLTSFTCTAPFLGTLLVVASQGDWQWPLAGMIAFSTVFALPFVVLALVPQLLASLPRSGPWLIAVKAAMGLIELAAAMKFLSNVDLVWGWGIFTRPVVLATWVVIAIVLVAYLAGLTRIGHAPRLGRPGIFRWSAVGAGIVLGVWLASGLAGRRLGELEAFLPPADLAKMAHGGELDWIVNDYDAALVEARRQNARILVDFTGYTCTNCRWMEANMFTRPEIARELARYVRVRLYTDGRGEIYRRYQRMEQERFGTVALPYYAVLEPDGRPIVGFGGLTRDPAEYLAFLRYGLE